MRKEIVAVDKAKRGDMVEAYKNGPIGTYVGNTGGSHWIAWDPCGYDEMVETFDRMYPTTTAK